MSKVTDLTGRKFNKLTVLSLDTKAPCGKWRWKCQCECGNTVSVIGSNLRRGHTKSCGCLEYHRSPNHKMIGKVFGRLTVEARVLDAKSHDPKYLCKCSCGGETVVAGNILRAGEAKSCGCLRKEIPTTKLVKNIEGMRFGRLIVLEQKESDKWRNKHWLCKCDCGNLYSTSGNSLQSGKVTSCGCYHIEQIRKANSTHGLSKTKAYQRYIGNKRREKQQKHDCQWTLEMQSVLSVFQPVCVVCEAGEHLTTDHVQPLKDGHGLKPGNAIRLCGSCNSRKNAKRLAQLSTEIRFKVVHAAYHFKIFWQSEGKYGDVWAH